MKKVEGKREWTGSAIDLPLLFVHVVSLQVPHKAIMHCIVSPYLISRGVFTGIVYSQTIQMRK